MFAFLTKFLLIARSRLRSQARLQAEILVLRQQVLVLSRKSGVAGSAAEPRSPAVGLALTVIPLAPGGDHYVKPETGLR